MPTIIYGGGATLFALVENQLFYLFCHAVFAPDLHTVFVIARVIHTFTNRG